MSREIHMVCGSRGYKNREEVEDWVRTLAPSIVLIHGNCPNSPDVWAGKEAAKAGIVMGGFPYVKCFGRVGGACKK